MSDPSPDSLGKPGGGVVAQSVTLASRFLGFLVLVLACAWLASGTTTVQPGSRAVVLRGGRIDREHGAGLVIALPRPFEDVEVVPGAESQQSLLVTDLDLTQRGKGNAETFDVRAEGGYALTGDIGVIRIQGTVNYRISDASAWFLARDQVAPALRRTFCAAVVAACARRPLDGVLVARAAAPDATDAAVTEDTRAASDRENLRQDVATDLAKRLAPLGLGIEVQRVDLTAFLPDQAQQAFDAVTAAAADAAAEIARANTTAERNKQQADQDADNKQHQAEAKARETIAAATAATNEISALEAETSPLHRRLLLERIYRERIEAMLGRATVIAIDPRQPIWLGLPGGN